MPNFDLDNKNFAYTMDGRYSHSYYEGRQQKVWVLQFICLALDEC